MNKYEALAEIVGKSELEVARIIRGLAPLERKVMETRFLPTTLSETAKQLGITPERVSEIERNILEMLYETEEEEE